MRFITILNVKNISFSCSYVHSSHYYIRIAVCLDKGPFHLYRDKIDISLIFNITI